MQGFNSLDTFLYTNIKNVKLFGAVGDGVADDTAAIIAAIASISKGIVFLPAGIYKVSSTLVLKMDITLMGTGYAATTINYTGVGNCISIKGTSPANRITDVAVKDLHINCGRVAYLGAQHGIEIKYATSYIFLENLFIINCGDTGLILQGDVYDLHASNIHIGGCMGCGVQILNLPGEGYLGSNDNLFYDLKITNMINVPGLVISGCNSNQFYGLIFDSMTETTANQALLMLIIGNNSLPCLNDCIFGLVVMDCTTAAGAYNVYIAHSGRNLISGGQVGMDVAGDEPSIYLHVSTYNVIRDIFCEGNNTRAVTLDANSNNNLVQGVILPRVGANISNLGAGNDVTHNQLG